MEVHDLGEFDTDHPSIINHPLLRKIELKSMLHKRINYDVWRLE